MHNQTVQSYLRKHESPLSQRYAQTIKQSYQQALVIPLYDEDPECLRNLTAHIDTSATLIIAVVNAPQGAPQGARQRTENLLTTLADATRSNVMIVDCVSQPLPAKAGVGLARKIGTDIALRLQSTGQVASPWLYQSDADAQLPANYFDERGHNLCDKQGAVVFGHRHYSTDASLTRAVRLYEKHMQYYVTGLAQAGSTYAYPSLGSTIAIHSISYAAVRGYPQRNAAEDFYLLNKIAKVHGVVYLPRTVVSLAARLSDRVPFGTGPALHKITAALKESDNDASYLSYHPNSFLLLAEALAYLAHFADTTRSATHLDQRVRTLLDAVGFDRIANTVKKHYQSKQRRQEILMQWFDAGKTLRFIHEARRYYPDQPLVLSLQQNLLSRSKPHYGLTSPD